MSREQGADGLVGSSVQPTGEWMRFEVILEEEEADCLEWGAPFGLSGRGPVELESFREASEGGEEIAQPHHSCLM